MYFKSPLTSLNHAINSTHSAYRTIASELLGVDPNDLDGIIAASLATVGSCATAGWHIGYIIAGEPGAASGAVVGACIGIVVVLGTITYKIYMSNFHHCVPVNFHQCVPPDFLDSVPANFLVVVPRHF